MMHIILCSTQVNVYTKANWGSLADAHSVSRPIFCTIKILYQVYTTSHIKISTLVSTYTSLENLYQELQVT